MDRNQSYKSEQTSHRRQQQSVLPPWEVRAVSQVPFIEPKSPPLMERDTNGFFNPRASAYPQGRPRLANSTSAPPCPSAEYVSPVSDDNSTCPWKVTGPVQAVAPPPLPPYETHYGNSGAMPAMMKKSSSVAAYPVQAPPTPPESFTRASDRSASSSPPIARASKALPGTMTSRAGRNRENARARAKSSAGREHRSRTKEPKPDAQPLGKRFKTAFKDMFKKDPVDESQFEKITAQHWTDEY